MSAEEAWGSVVSSYGHTQLVRTNCGALFNATRKGKKNDIAVGDRVKIALTSQNTARIEEIAPRKNLFFRQDEWRIKTLASNVDLLIALFSSVPAFNADFIWRALIAAHFADIPALIIRNKTDVAEGAQKAKDFLEQCSALGYRTLSISAKTAPESVIRDLALRIQGKTCLLIGQSGMGKSTTLNRLIPDARAKTQAYSVALNAGKQTTTSSTLYKIDEETNLIDTPGFQNFGLMHIEPADLQKAMPDFLPYIGQCRFYNCLHDKEPGCSVKAAAAAGKIMENRYRFYLRTLSALKSGKDRR